MWECWQIKLNRDKPIGEAFLRTSTKVTNRYAAVLLWSPKIGTPSNAKVWKFSEKEEKKNLSTWPKKSLHNIMNLKKIKYLKKHKTEKFLKGKEKKNVSVMLTQEKTDQLTIFIEIQVLYSTRIYSLFCNEHCQTQLS